MQTTGRLPLAGISGLVEATPTREKRWALFVAHHVGALCSNVIVRPLPATTSTRGPCYGEGFLLTGNQKSQTIHTKETVP